MVASLLAVLAVQTTLYWRVRHSQALCNEGVRNFAFRLAAGLACLEQVLATCSRHPAAYPGSLVHSALALVASAAIGERYCPLRTLDCVWSTALCRLLLSMVGASWSGGGGAWIPTIVETRCSLITSLALLTAAVLVERAYAEPGCRDSGQLWATSSNCQTQQPHHHHQNHHQHQQHQHSNNLQRQSLHRAQTASSTSSSTSSSNSQLDDHCNDLARDAVRRKRPLAGHSGDAGRGLSGTGSTGGVANGMGFVNGRRTSLPVLTERVSC